MSDDNEQLDDIFEEEEIKEPTKNKNKNKNTSKYKPGVGVDVGTSNIVVARQKQDGTFENRFHRNMLYPLNISEEATDLLENSNYLYVQVGEKYYVVGEDALKLVNAIGTGKVIRPMKDGILNPSLKASSELLFYIIKAVVGDAVVNEENLRFSCPANPIDRDIDNLFHKMTLTAFFKKIGYNPKAVNEAMCIGYDCNPIMKESGGGESHLSGICCSCGAGQWNLALSYKGLSLIEFSCTKSGDHLDEQVAKATGIPTNKVIKIKERTLDLNNINMSDSVQSALSIYSDEMLDRMAHHICNQFRDKSSEMDGQIEIIVAGGTSMVPGFCDRLKEAIGRVDMPFDIYNIRQSKTPFYSVAQGACIRAQADCAKDKK